MAIRNPAMKMNKNLSTGSRLNMQNAKKRKLGAKIRGNNLIEVKPKNAEEPHKKFAFYAPKSMKIWRPPLRINTEETVKQCDKQETDKQILTANVADETSHHSCPDKAERKDIKEQKHLGAQLHVAEDQLHCRINAHEEDERISDFLHTNFDATQNLGNEGNENQFRREDQGIDILDSYQSAEREFKAKSILLELENNEFLEKAQKNQAEHEKNEILELGKAEIQDDTPKSRVQYVNNQILGLEEKKIEENTQENKVKTTQDGQFPSKLFHNQEEYEEDMSDTAVKIMKVADQSNCETDINKMICSPEENLIEAKANFSNGNDDKNYEKTAGFQTQRQNARLNTTEFTNEKSYNKHDTIRIQDTEKELQNDETDTTEGSTSGDDLDNYISKRIELYINNDKQEQKLKDMTELDNSSQETVILSPDRIKKPILQSKKDHLNNSCRGTIKQIDSKNALSCNKETEENCLEAVSSHELTSSAESNTYSWKNNGVKKSQNSFEITQEKSAVSSTENYLEFHQTVMQLLQSEQPRFLEDRLNNAVGHDNDDTETKTCCLQEHIKLAESPIQEESMLGQNLSAEKNVVVSNFKVHDQEFEKRRDKNESLKTLHILEGNNRHPKDISDDLHNNGDGHENCPEENDYILDFHNDVETDLFFNLDENDITATTIPQPTDSNFSHRNSNPFCEPKVFDELHPGKIPHQNEKLNKSTVKEKFFRTFTELYENKCLIGNNFTPNIGEPFVDKEYSANRIVRSPCKILRNGSQQMLKIDKNMAPNDENQRLDDFQRKKMGGTQRLQLNSTNETKHINTQRQDFDTGVFPSQMDFKNTGFSKFHSPSEQQSDSDHVKLFSKNNYQDNFDRTSFCYELECPQITSRGASSHSNENTMQRKNQAIVQERLHFLVKSIGQRKKDRERKIDDIRDAVSQTNTLVNELIDRIK